MSDVACKNGAAYKHLENHAIDYARMPGPLLRSRTASMPSELCKEHASRRGAGVNHFHDRTLPRNFDIAPDISQRTASSYKVSENKHARSACLPMHVPRAKAGTQAHPLQAW